MSKINDLLLSGRNIWTLDDMSAIWGQRKRSDTAQSAKQYARSGDLVRIRRGIYALPGAKLVPSEIARKLVAPSYLTGESVLKKSGMSFQLSSHITSAALVSRQIALDDHTYVYYKLNDQIFFNPLGVTAGIASPERAVADLIYISGGRYQFEDLSNIDWEKLRVIGQIYSKKSVLNNIAKLKELYAGDI
jgi:hypothetical protein